MGDDFHYLDIIIFAVVAGFLVLRLRNVLGRRTGTERPRPLFGVTRKEDGAAANGVVRPLNPVTPARRPPPPASPEPVRALSPNVAAVDRIRAADPSFEADRFLSGARAAFEMIVAAFAQGDTAVLKPLLSAQVYRDFAQAIAGRERAKEALETRIVAVSRAEIEDAELDGRMALVTVRFQSQQTNVIRDAGGQILEGDAERPLDKVDLWTFARDVGSSSPNWELVTTASP